MTSPIFISAFARSGTSLLAQILNRHSNIALFHESSLYIYLVRDSQILQNGLSWKQLENYVSHLINLPSTLLFKHINTPLLSELDINVILNKLHTKSITPASIYHAIFSTWASTIGKNRWGDKFCQYIFFIEEILSDFPDAQFIHIVRDPRPVYCSMQRSNIDSFSHLSLYRSIDSWKYAMQTIQQVKSWISKSQFYEIKYETLLLQPQETLKCLCEFLNEPFESSMLTYYENLQNKFQFNIPQAHKNLIKPINSEQMDKWKYQLKQSEITAIEYMTSKERAIYNYPSIVNDQFGIDIPRKCFLDIYQKTEHLRRWYRRQLWLDEEKNRLLKVQHAIFNPENSLH